MYIRLVFIPRHIRLQRPHLEIAKHPMKYEWEVPLVFTVHLGRG